MNLHRISGHLRRAIDRLTVFGAVIGGVFTGLMTLMVGYAVVGRYLLNRPIGWSEEVAMYLMVWAVFLGASYTLKEDAHIGVDLVISRLKPGWKRGLLTVHYLIGIVFFAILFYKGIQMVSLSIRMGASSMAMEIPLYFPQLAVPVGAAILILQCLNKLLALGDGSP